MKILWVVNILLPEVSELLNRKNNPFGGWLVNSSKELSKREDIDLIIAAPNNKNKKTLLKGKRVNYYLFNPNNEETIKNMLKEIKPDLVHIHGTEFNHTLKVVNKCNELNLKVVISIQGLVSVIAKHMDANLPFSVRYGMTLRNILLNDSVSGLKKQFIKRGKSEIEAIKNVRNIIGRTTWDYACINQINSSSKYYHCNESLRSEFYKYKWNINNIEKKSIFISQGQSSIKGLHYVIEALTIVKEKYSDVKLYIGGKNIISNRTLKEYFLQTYYSKYIKKLIKRYKLEKNIFFTGELSEMDMCSRYLKSNIFICPSTIENSPNSLGEAMLLGVPLISTNVGGIQDMLEHKKEGYIYQTDAHYMLAHYICKIFDDDNLAKELSKNAILKAEKTHDLKANIGTLLEIYNNLI